MKDIRVDLSEGCDTIVENNNNNCGGCIWFTYEEGCLLFEGVPVVRMYNMNNVKGRTE